jgi:enamine deaminase RidA (YjgF/YER057c/UK114 family)
MPVRRISSGSPFEDIIGFSRAMRIGNILAVSGTAPIDDQGNTAAPGDLAEQTQVCLQLILDAINVGGGTKEHVIRTRIMLTDISRWREAAALTPSFSVSTSPLAPLFKWQHSSTWIGWSKSKLIAFLNSVGPIVPTGYANPVKKECLASQ